MEISLFNFKHACLQKVRKDNIYRIDIKKKVLFNDFFHASRRENYVKIF